MSTIAPLSVSVVMSVYDKPHDVRLTVDSVLAQQGVELELVVVSDGASDDVNDVLAAYQDSRLNIIYQTNQGLTVALANGCNHAKHEYIARVDAGDEMLAGRLLAQAQTLERDKSLALVCCWVHMHTEEGFKLYDVQYSAKELTQGLSTTQPGQLKSPVHSSVMFRKAHYVEVGGYRPEFYFTQDCDLWARLLHCYPLSVIEDVLQKAVFSASGISGLHKQQQTELANLVVQANVLRQQGKNDTVILEQAKQYKSNNDNVGGHKAVSRFAGNYFIASVLSKQQPKAALVYWHKALTEKPLAVNARLKWFVCLLRSWFTKQQ